MGLKVVRRLAITFGILGALFVGLNIAGERFAEGRLGDVIAARFDLEQDPSVDIEGFPILLSIIRGELPALTVAARDVTVEDLTVAQLAVTLRGLEVTGGLLGGDNLAVEVGEGRIEAMIGQAAINRHLKRQGEDARVRLSDGRVRVMGTATFAGQRGRYDAIGTVRLAKRRLIFDPERVTVDGRRVRGAEADAWRRLATFDVQIPELPGGFRATEVQPFDEALLLRATLTGKRISFGGQE